MKVIYNEDYKKLFARAERALKEAGKGDDIVIDSLASYYEYLDELVQSCSPEFIRSLPYTEQYFKINTNDRKIQVPTDLLSVNGASPKWVIGVKDDHQAEILWFSIDRFYDDVDLAICFPRLSEVENDQNGAGQTYIQWKNKATEGLDEVVYVQITEDITDEEDIALGLESNKIYFGWVLRGDSTGAITRPLDVSGDLTFSVRFQYHAHAVENNRPDLRSEVLFSFNTMPVTCTVYPNLTEQMSNPNMNISDLKLEDTHGQGMVRPRFSGIYDNTRGPKPLLESDLSNYIDLNPDTNEIELTVTAKAPQQGNVLEYQWYKDGQYIPTATSNTYTATTVGSYKVHIGNTYRTTPKATRWIESNTCEVPAPSNLVFEKNLPPYGFVDQSETLGTLSVEMQKLPDSWGRETGEITYTWYREPLGADEHQETLEDGTFIQVIESNSPTYVPALNKPGRYYVRVVNHYNNADTKPQDSDVAIMKARAAMPNSVTHTYDEDTNIITAHVDIEHKNDLYYKWTNESTGISTSWIKDGYQYQPTSNGQYYCRVAQVIYKDTSIQDGNFETYTPATHRVNITSFEQQ